MDWFTQLLSPPTLALLIPIVVIIGVFGNKALKAHHSHVERLAKINQGIDPDQKK
ncbi:hypothetical protein SG34_026840 [Thalassomonas viridans]|uniref:Uncharacterized protein n=1 Tax=Thalassomonas viridans TaxID=137584 RepID=A0AAE9Z269_9GAMM|nr:hypothetical protein [Thalassomonas viridans]WDE04882.1 hypothetical protein SG34_026840 [Thalassomonas viridans]